jgi:hypothetical protein
MGKYRIGGVANKVRVVVIQKAERPVVDGKAEDRHVVGVQHAVSPAYALPFWDDAVRQINAT